DPGGGAGGHGGVLRRLPGAPLAPEPQRGGPACPALFLPAGGLSALAGTQQADTGPRGNSLAFRADAMRATVTGGEWMFVCRNFDARNQLGRSMMTRPED